MAFANPLNPLEDQEQQQSQMPLQGPATAAQAMSGSQGGQSQPTQSVNRGGSQFADISSYLTQNQPQAQRLASKVGGNVVEAGERARSAGTQAQNQLKGAQTAFNTASNANHLQYDPNIVNRAASNPNSFFQPLARDPGRGGWPTADPTQPYPTTQLQTNPGSTGDPRYVTAPTNSTVRPGPTPSVLDQAGFDAFQAQRNADYKGPTDLGFNIDYSPIDQLAGTAKTLTEGTKSDTGRRDLLRNVYGADSASTGASNLDSLLLRSSAAQNILDQSAKENAGIGDLPSSLRSDEGTARGEAADRLALEEGNEATIKQNVNDAFLGEQGAYTNFNKEYQGRLTAAQQAAERLSQQNFTGSSEGDLAAQDQLRNINNVASEEDYQKLQALNALMGSNYGF